MRPIHPMPAQLVAAIVPPLGFWLRCQHRRRYAVVELVWVFAVLLTLSPLTLLGLLLWMPCSAYAVAQIASTPAQPHLKGHT